MKARAWVVGALVVACGDRVGGDAPGEKGPGAAGGVDAGATEPGSDSGAGAGAGAGERDGGAGLVIATRVITTSHRAIPGVMFGGWGPHLGHLVRRPGGELWFVDDACEACDVNVNARVDAFRLVGDAWERRAQIALPAGVQQNTGTIVTGDAFETYGVDVASSRIVTCRLEPTTLASSCAPIAIALPPSTNYVGAAVSPDGWKMTWATTVVDGGGGSFHWLVDYGGGWNGPRTGTIGGYNDASYVNVSFFGGARKAEHVFFAQLVGGLAPNWTFHGAVADGNAGGAAAPVFALLAGPPGDAVASTNDVVVDPLTNDAHLVARTASGAAALFMRPSGGARPARPRRLLPRRALRRPVDRPARPLRGHRPRRAASTRDA